MPPLIQSSAGRALAIACLWGVTSLSGCAGQKAARRDAPPGSSSAATAQAPAGSALPAASIPVPAGRRIATSEEAEAARRDLDYLAEGSPERARLFRDLLAFHVGQAAKDLDRGHLEDAFEGFESALTLFSPADLQDPASPPQAPELWNLATRLDAAFRRRGAHPEVVTALMVERTLRTTDEAVTRRYHELASWLSGAPVQGPIYRGQRRDLLSIIREPPTELIRDLEQTVKVWPSRAVVSELSGLYLAEAHNGAAGASSAERARALREMLGIGRPLPLSQPAFKLARLYLRIGQPQEGLRVINQLRQFSKLSPQEMTLVTLMENAFAPGAAPTEGVTLAMALAQNSDDADVSLAICRDLARRTPQAVVAFQCVGELAGRLERTGLAIRAYERARELSPGDRAVWERLALLYQMRLSDLVGDERTADLTGALTQVESFFGQMRKQFPDLPEAVNLAPALSEVGRGYYNAGHVDDAVRYLERSVAIEANAAALELLGTIHLKRGQADRAQAILERARAVEMASPRAEAMFKVYFRARIGRLLAEALDLREGSAQAAAEARRAALRDWGQLLESDRLVPERRAEAEMERGKLYYQLGERDPALAAFQAAVDAVPEEGQGQKGQVYADAIAFLVQRGEIDEAMEAYHRALGRAKVTEYLKVYCSLWINDLLRRAGQPEDPLATAFLRSVAGEKAGGGKWYAELARWATGQQGEDVLMQRADTVGKKAEANFYVGMQKWSGGDRPRAEALLRQVLKSDMMAFFEYEMAAYYLKRGAPTGPAIRDKGKGTGGALKAPGKKDRKRPSGSI